jgi:hypothetical protein
MGSINRLVAMAATAGVLGASAPAAQEPFDRGRALYENHCEHCHEGWAHTRDRRSVTSLEGLRARVASWSVHADLDWTAEDIRDVTDYLNRRFYHLTE